MPRLIWTESALRDLTDLDAYPIDQDAGPSAARILDSASAADRPCDDPDIGRSLVDDVRVRTVARTPYLLVYTMDQDDVAILRVLHERRNWRDDRFPRA